MSFQDWMGWVAYSDHEPWGEKRDDMRMATVVANIHAPFSRSVTQTPNLIWPYIQSPEDRLAEAQALLDKKKAKYGTKPRQNGDTPGA
jgi:hypothetical protein